MLKQYLAIIESELPHQMKKEGLAPLLTESMEYGLLSGGKRIRPCLLLHVCKMLGGDIEAAVPYACALEMIHSYSLIHDDLPAMDNDDFRRGRPSNHKQFGEGNAILAGDGLLTEAALLLAKQKGNDAAKEAILSAALDMVSGQSYDLNEISRTEEMLHLLHAQKTGALFRAAFLAGACLAGREDLTELFSKLGQDFGLLFQMTDDLLDAEKDVKENKFTYLTFYGESRTRELIAETEKQIRLGLAAFQNEESEELRSFLHFMTNRTE